MNLKTKLCLAALILTVGMLATACPERRNIGDIEANPSRYFDKEVAVAGKVENAYGVSIPLIRNGQGGAYKINDGTGSIWVITQKNVPTKGVELGVKGKVQNGVNINGRNYGLVIIEDDRRFKR